MKLAKLEVSAVRASETTDRVTSLSSRELRAIVGTAENPTCEDVPPEICAIHDYYIRDVLE